LLPVPLEEVVVAGFFDDESLADEPVEESLDAESFDEDDSFDPLEEDSFADEDEPFAPALSALALSALRLSFR
jgi:hypothetical protein